MSASVWTEEGTYVLHTAKGLVEAAISYQWRDGELWFQIKAGDILFEMKPTAEESRIAAGGSRRGEVV